MKSIYLWGFVVIVFAILGAGIYVFSDAECFHECYSCEIDRQRVTAFATFVGGLLSGFSVLFLLLTLDHQIKQSRIDEITKRFFLMLEIHKKNVEELSILKALNSDEVLTGKNSIDHIISDFVRIFNDVRGFRKREADYLPADQAMDLGFAYDILYFGLDEYRIDILWSKESTWGQAAIGDPPSKEFLEKLGNSEDERERFSAYLYDSIMSDKDSYLNKYQEWQISFYAGFQGYHNQLGHYFRHLYNMVHYINKQLNGLFSVPAKYEIVKMLRTQLTNNEQKLVFLNSFFKYGNAWEFRHRGFTQAEIELSNTAKSKLLITRYRFIKNLPKGIVFEGIVAKTFFPDIDFEDPDD